MIYLMEFIKIYKNNNLIDEIGYFDGKKFGKAKEFYDNDKICFEGEYLEDGIRKGIEYEIKGNIIFEGESKIYNFTNDIMEYSNGRK